MNKELCIKALNETIKNDGISMSYIAKELKIDASIVSKVAAGRFKKMTGNALEICKFALTFQAEKRAKIKNPDLSNQLRLVAAELVVKSPAMAEALAEMMLIVINKHDADGENLAMR